MLIYSLSLRELIIIFLAVVSMKVIDMNKGQVHANLSNKKPNSSMQKRTINQKNKLVKSIIYIGKCLKITNDKMQTSRIYPFHSYISHLLAGLEHLCTKLTWILCILGQSSKTQHVKLILELRDFIAEDSSNKFLRVFQYYLRIRKIIIKSKGNRKIARNLKISLGKRGLVNLGNTCFMNSALQCLYKTIQIQRNCSQFSNQNQCPLLDAYIELCNQLKKTGSDPYPPSKIREIVAAQNYIFQGFRQGDACEWITTFLNKLNVQTNQAEGIKNYKIDVNLRRGQHQQQIQKLWLQSKKKDILREKSIIDDIVYGRFKVTYKCIRNDYWQSISCGGSYTLFEKFMIVYLLIPQSIHKHNLSDCFDQFCAVDKLEGENSMRCDQCQSQTTMEKQITLYQTNQVLILCLKRFDKYIKKVKQINVPLALDGQLLKRCGNRQNESYRLYGLILHKGSLKNGHYTAICYDQTNEWVHFNDTYCKKVAQEIVFEAAKSAYVLFYRKQN